MSHLKPVQQLKKSHLKTVYKPAVRTDDAYLYWLKSRYSRISSFIRKFSCETSGRESAGSFKALKTSARI